MQICRFFLAVLSTVLSCASASALDVASLHPLLTDLLKQVGGKHVVITELAKPGFDVHTFQPRSEDLAGIASSKLIFASGKQLEPYLHDFSQSLKPGQKIIEVGSAVPSLESDEVCDHPGHDHHDHGHAHGAVDPHWWHSVTNMERATRFIGTHLAEADPVNAADYEANAAATTAKLRSLNTWVKREVASIPRAKRHLVTSHAAFAYFCDAYGFHASFVQGLSKEGDISTGQLRETIEMITRDGITAIFPELGTNPKILAQIAESTGAKVSDPLIADGSVASYETMMRSNVTTIVAALK